MEEEESDYGSRSRSDEKNPKEDSNSKSIDLKWWYWYNRKQQAYPEPLIRAAWAGDFTVLNSENKSRTIKGFSCCLSNKSLEAVRLAVERFPTTSILWEEVPKSCVWPKSFEESGPAGDDIAAYFFPMETKQESEYEALVFHMIRHDLALQAGSELLVFTSLDLPQPLRRFQGKVFLWAVFKGYRPLV